MLHRFISVSLAIFCTALVSSLVLVPMVLAQSGDLSSGDLSIDSKSIKFSTNTFVEGQKIRIYATSVNTTKKDLYGVVKFFEDSGKKQIGTDQPISVFAGKTDDIFVDWYATAGETEIFVQLIPFDEEGDVPNNNTAQKTVFVETDFDRDGIADSADNDDDNDGTKDEEDAFPKNKKEQKDSDGDGTGNNQDTDDDNDGFPDENDAFPMDATEHQDSDKDGIGEKADPDDDNDGKYDGEEIAAGTNPLNADTDGDKTVDGKDVFPLNPQEQRDTDKDGKGNNEDLDDDNDKVPDTEDRFPTNIPPVVKKKGFTFVTAPKKEIVFDASISHDPDGKITKLVWKIDDNDDDDDDDGDDDGKEQEGLIIRHEFKKIGKHTVTIKATDDAGETVSKSYTIYVTKTGSTAIGIILLLVLSLAIYGVLKYSIFASRRRK